jgi:predicted aspartyl protease
VYKGDRWHENENGHVVLDQADPGLESGETFTTTVTRVSTPVNAYVIANLNASGHGTREYIDPSSYFVVRRENIAPNGTTVTVYDTFRAFGTRHLATHWTVHDEKSGTDTEYTLREYTAGDVADADVAIPIQKRMLVEFPDGQNRVVLPARFEPSGHVLVHVTIAGRGLDLMLDTGASTITIDPGVAASLGLTVTNQQQSSVNAGRFPTGQVFVHEIAVGPLTMHDVAVQIVPWDWQEAGARAVGLLGFDFLCESGITIDYERQTVTAERYGWYAPPTDPRTIELDARLGSQVPLTSVAIDGAVAERMMVDTGGAGPFLLFDYFTRHHPGLNLHTAVGPPRQLSGAGGLFNSAPVEIDDLTLGNVHFRDFWGFRASAASYAQNADGVIGPAFLSFFDVHLDYPNGKIYLVPNATGLRFMH